MCGIALPPNGSFLWCEPRVTTIGDQNIMRYPIISLALASSVLAAPAYAREGALYVEGQLGPMLVEDIHFDIGANCCVW